MEAGIPQGCVLGPLLFNLYVAGIPTLTHCKITQYADDTIIYYPNKEISTLVQRMQIDLNDLYKYFKDWKSKIYKEQTKAMVFNEKAKKMTEKLKIERAEMEWASETKYLGVTLDPNHKTNLTLQQHRTRNDRLDEFSCCGCYDSLKDLSTTEIFHIIYFTTKSIALDSLMQG